MTARDLKSEAMEAMAPGQLKFLREVNADFFELTGRLGIAGALKNSIREHMNGLFAALSNRDIPRDMGLRLRILPENTEGL